MTLKKYIQYPGPRSTYPVGGASITINSPLGTRSDQTKQTNNNDSIVDCRHPTTRAVGIEDDEPTVAVPTTAVHALHALQCQLL